MGAIISIISLASAVWVIYDVWSNNFRLSKEYKLLWTIAAIIFSILTAIVYYVVEKAR
jgi:membrane protein DedA with SNARE-associated domain